MFTQDEIIGMLMARGYRVDGDRIVAKNGGYTAVYGGDSLIERVTEKMNAALERGVPRYADYETMTDVLYDSLYDFLLCSRG